MSLRNSVDWIIEANYLIINLQSSKHSFSFLRIGPSQFGRDSAVGEKCEECIQSLRSEAQREAGSYHQ